ncbi:IS66 family insertion sequence element accessory protein TnpA [Polyangium aurulentum]|uniref:IS66 family insertion sequence element accessory protein TnpA n=1 Tax=Polyangium aurulentum TaxID=2567896 RepID=UPI0010AEB57A|nr:hypothetical protein [Polyangium aurulentum]UQA57051.1 hypothetical protein E8A73_038035 [Polyangium aurulentum]UQA57086.1 hypothetical protein E8A73_038220 [Polyangium aurulentum]
MATRTTKTERRWRRIVEKWRSSGLLAREFAAQQKISPGTLYWWSSRLGKKAAARGPDSPVATMPKLLPVEIVDEAPHLSQPLPAALEIVLPHGEVIRVPPGADLTHFRRVVAALRGGLA